MTKKDLGEDTVSSDGDGHTDESEDDFADDKAVFRDLKAIQRREIKKKSLRLSEDFYAIAFLSYLNKHAFKYNISRVRQSEYFYSCIWIFMMQLCIMFLIFDEVVLKNDHFTIEIHSFEVYLAQLFACTLLHMELVLEINQALGMLKYLNMHPDKFTNISTPFMIASMQLVGGLFSEIINILMLSTRHSVVHCLEHFVAFHLLTQIDDIYAHALPHFPLKDELKTPLLY